jgi:hypothetical protein
MYWTEEGVTFDPALCIDDNLTPLSLEAADQLCPLLSLHDEYTGVSGLNININKTTAVFMNTAAFLCEQLQLLWMTTPDICLHLGKNTTSTVEANIAKIEPKLI